jgi:hypothetical protein
LNFAIETIREIAKAFGSRLNHCERISFASTVDRESSLIDVSKANSFIHEEAHCDGVYFTSEVKQPVNSNIGMVRTLSVSDAQKFMYEFTFNENHNINLRVGDKGESRGPSHELRIEDLKIENGEIRCNQSGIFNRSLYRS